MNTLTVRERVLREIVAITSGHVTIEGVAAVRPEQRFKEDLAVDSLDLVELSMNIEDEFDIEIPDEAAEAWTTVAEVLAYVEGRLGATA